MGPPAVHASTASPSYAAEVSRVEAVKALLLENIHPLAVEILEGRGFEVELLTRSLSEDELVEALPGVSLLGT